MGCSNSKATTIMEKETKQPQQQQQQQQQQVPQEQQQQQQVPQEQSKSEPTTLHTAVIQQANIQRVTSKNTYGTYKFVTFMNTTESFHDFNQVGEGHCRLNWDWD